MTKEYERMHTIEELSKWLKVDADTIAAEIKAGKLQVVRVGKAQQIRVPHSQLVAYLGYEPKLTGGTQQC